jgi:hypothetical protein|tara:strand:+ start:224 stop:373 length:150 start_codon:yes stop_codon:yes gene_type:complete
MLQEEIEYAESQLQPHDTGHIHTAISWMKSRLDNLKKDMGKELDEVSTQ